MAKIRVYELAKQVNMTNKALLEKLEELNIPIKSHMSVLDEETASGIKATIFGHKSEMVVEKRVKDTVIRRRKRIVKEPELEQIPVEVEPAVPTVTEEQIMPEPVRPEAVPEKTPEPPVAEVAEQVPEPPSIEVEAAEGVESQPSQPETEVTAPQEAPVVDKLGETPAALKVPVKKRPKTKKEEPAKIIKLPEISPVEIPPPPIEYEATPIKQMMEQAPPVLPKGLEEPVREPVKIKAKKKEKKAVPAEEEDRRFLKKKITFRKKEVFERSDLYDGKGLRGRKERKLRKGKVIPIKGEKPVLTTPKAIKRRIKIDEAIVLSDLAKRMGIKASEIIRQLMVMGIMANVNQALDFETASVIASEFNYEVEKTAFEEEDLMRVDEDEPGKLKPRPPVVTIMGHVDHGKTSLLDAIRQTNVMAGEAGGITQHIGAYYVAVDDRQVVFLDTPGHEAFTAMRARGAEVTDLVVLVVAADDGVMPQTLEAINHAKAAQVPMLVAVNKIDKPEANPERVRRELAERGLSPEEWGGETIFVNVSAKEKTGIDNLLEMILLQADVLELKANPDKRARGHVIEARLDPGRGPVATVLVEEGTLRAADAVVCGLQYGKIRAMTDDRGGRLDTAGPAMPVEIQGLSGVPMAGDEFVAVRDERLAKQVSFHRAQKQRVREMAKTSKLTLEKYYEQMKDGFVKDLNLVIRGDVQGSVEALAEAIQKIPSTEVKVNVTHSATGAITESDVMLAAVSNAIVVGFNVRPNPKVRELANEQNVDIRFYDVIYNVINDIKGAMAGLMEPKFEEHVMGRAEVRETFTISKIGMIAGCYVTDGKIERGKSARLLRDGVVVYDGKIGSLRRFKDDVKEVQSGYECGIGIENFNDIKVNDVIECYRLEEVKRALE